MKKYLYLTILFLKLATVSIACSCSDIPTFSEIATSEQIKRTDLVVLVKITRFFDYQRYNDYSADSIPMAMDAIIIYKYKGVENSNTITVLGGFGSDCRVNLKRLMAEKYLLLALTKTGDKSNNQYSLFECGEYFVKFTIWMYCIYLALSIIALYVVYRVIKKIKKHNSADTGKKN